MCAAIAGTQILRKERFMRRRLAFAVLLLAALSLAVTTTAGKPAAANDLASFVIQDFEGAALLSDSRGAYEDWRLPGDPCVTAWAASTGLFFAYFYRGSDLGDDCNGANQGPVRTYQLMFADSTACANLVLGSAPCTLNLDSTTNQPRIRAEKLFGRTAVTTPVAFLFNKSASYEVRLDSEVGIDISGDTRTLSNDSGTASLWRLGGKKPVRVGSPFVFPFSLSVTRVAQ